MRALPILASLLLAAPALAKTTASKTTTSPKSELQKQCDEKELQIKELTEENTRLKSLLASATRTTPAEATKATEKASKPADDGKPDNSPMKVTVRDGDTWVKVAKRNDTTAEALAKLNHRKVSSQLEPGDKILVPNKKDEEIATRDDDNVGGTHVVRDGETFYSIGKHYGLGAEAIQDANPKVKANALRTGMVLKIGARTLVAKSNPPSKSEDKKVASTRKSSRKEESSSSKTEIAGSSKPREATTHHSEPASKEPAVEKNNNDDDGASTEMVSNNHQKVRTINIDKEISFGSFAQAHGITPEKLNALNGLNLNSSTVLAQGSELRVPAQP